MVAYEDMGSRWTVYVVDCGGNIDNVVGGDIMKPYNGHRSWNAWNVALWIGNDESLYRTAMHCIETGRLRSISGTKRSVLNRAVREFLACVNWGSSNAKTPDGAVYNRLSVKLALEGLMED